MIDAAALLNNARDSYTAGVQGQVNNQARANASMTEQQARAAGEQFESFFIGQMVEMMQTDIDGDGMFGGGHAENVWRSMLNQEYGKEIAKHSTLGVADSVVRSLLKTQDAIAPETQIPAMDKAAALAANAAVVTAPPAAPSIEREI